jgi:hypothetical protein
MTLRRTTLTRRTPLRARPKHTETERPPAPPINFDAAAAAIANRERSAAAPRREHAPVPEPVPAASKPHDTGFPRVVRETMLDRDNLTCQRCGDPIDQESFLGYSMQHRDNRHMGGTRWEGVNLPSNGITMCGSATTGCHGWAESNPTEAERLGFAVQSWADPTTVPVKTHRGWRLLTDNGTAWPCPEPPNGDAHTVAQRKAAAR